MFALDRYNALKYFEDIVPSNEGHLEFSDN